MITSKAGMGCVDKSVRSSGRTPCVKRVSLTRAIKAAAIVLGTPVRAFYSGMAKDRQGRLLDLPHGGWHELKVEQNARQRYFPLLGVEESREIRPEQDVWDHLVLFQPESLEEEREEQA